MGKQRKRHRTRRIVIIVIIVVVVLAVVIGLVVSRRNRRPERSVSDVVQASSATVTLGSITTTVVGTGNLENASAEEITIPAGVAVEEVLVESGDSVKAGDVLATLDLDALTATMLAVQEEIEELDGEIEDAMDDSLSTTVTAGVSGEVKEIYVEEGDSVAKIMADRGALLLLTADDEQETEISVTGAAGTVSEVCVSVGDSVSAGDTLIELADAAETAEYLSLVTERNTLASYLQELAEVSQSGEIRAEFDGIVQTVNVSDGETPTSSSSSSAAGLYGARAAESSTATVVAVSTSGSSGRAKPVKATAVSTGAYEQSGDQLREAAEETEETESAETEKVSVVKLKDVVTAPVLGETPQTQIEENDFYTGEIVWDTTDASFVEGTVYTAQVTLYAKTGENVSYAFSTDIEVEQTDATILSVTVTESELTYQVRFAAVSDDSSTSETETSVTIDSGTTVSSGSASSGTGNSVSASGAGSSSSVGSAAAGSSSGSSSIGTAGSTASSDLAADLSGAASSASSLSGSLSDSSSSMSSLTDAATAAASSASETDTGSVTAFTIAPDDTMLLSISVDELDILSVEVGQSAELTFDALEDQTYTGSITNISDTASVSGGVAKYTVQIELEKSEDMRAGMNGSATITVQDKQDILLIPSAALQERGNSVFVYTEQGEDGTLSGEVEVETGLSDGTNVEIVSGLSQGDTVYYTRIGTDGSSGGFDLNSILEGGGFGGGDFPFAGGSGEMPSMGGGGNFEGGGRGGMPNMN